MRTIAVRLNDGQDLLAEIKKLVATHNVDSGVILSGVGGLKQSKIRVPVVDGRVAYIAPETVEVDNLHGTVSKHGCHVHITVSDSQGASWGGHVKEGCIVRMSCELVIGVIDDIVFKREPDASTGYDELAILKR